MRTARTDLLGVVLMPRRNKRARRPCRKLQAIKGRSGFARGFVRYRRALGRKL